VSVSITLSIRLGPLVSLRVTGQSCHELAKALEGYDNLNHHINAMCGDLAERIYPEGLDIMDAVRDENEENEEGKEEEER
jgi:hypothetical protein